ncbi:MAG: holo-ACP synthase [Rhodospirillales bacterium RIFCSPLOWO2_12_FULL_58_28]|nr:MAG: holo-ACP synthase [Rhodospirillales bacterium RIFCSPLOWO2_02_FULL_58_16]OHC78999.1 MAG: holo-ACP synthase [Rhodospirillales bacterium RIFCSPLOWO2_12_FULL_58_28]
MILGIGSDLCDIRRVEKTLERFGERFIIRLYTETERQKAQSRANPAAVYAMSYAAKEACVKALGTGFRGGVSWRDVGVNNHASGKPFLTLTGGAEKRLGELSPPGMKAQIDLSLSDEYPMAMAMVVISAVPSASRLDRDHIGCLDLPGSK